MPPLVYRTSDVARAGKVHANTVRLYEAWGYIPAAQRTTNGYRVFTAYHLEQIRVVRLALRLSWVSGPIRAAALGVIACSAAVDVLAAQAEANLLDVLLTAEQAQAEAALRVVETWIAGVTSSEPSPAALSISETARTLGVSVDMLRNWERNGLIDVPRHPTNGYRQYGAPQIARLRVIRTLRRARYSMMAILRMLRRLDAGQMSDVRAALDTPDPDDDIQYVTDRWLSTLAEMRAALDELRALLAQMASAYPD